MCDLVFLFNKLNLVTFVCNEMHRACVAGYDGETSRYMFCFRSEAMSLCRYVFVSYLFGAFLSNCIILSCYVWQLQICSIKVMGVCCSILFARLNSNIRVPVGPESQPLGSLLLSQKRSHHVWKTNSRSHGFSAPKLEVEKERRFLYGLKTESQDFCCSGLHWKR